MSGKEWADAERDKWLPIASAPRAAKLVMIYGPEIGIAIAEPRQCYELREGRTHFIDKWEWDAVAFTDSNEGAFDSGEWAIRFSEEEITHWRSIPLPPATHWELPVKPKIS